MNFVNSNIFTLFSTIQSHVGQNRPFEFRFLLNFRIFEDHNNNKRYYSNNLNNMRLLNSIRGNGKDRVIFTESKSNFFVERTGIESIRQSRVDLLRSVNHQYDSHDTKGSFR